MPLLSLWASNRDAVGQFSIEQVVATAGDGALRDGSLCSKELREYLAQIPAPKISGYIDQCLNAALNKGGQVLQDLINELGRRLDFEVTNGRYQGVIGGIGYDGIWHSPEGHSIIAEIKTTDAYRLSLDTLAGYREKLAAAGQLKGSCSILIVVGRQDTGELEAQIRGSRHAWDIRLISAEALIKLVQLKENAERPETGRKIRGLLMPVEYTRLDRMVDVMFTTVADVERPTDDVTDDETSQVAGSAKAIWQFTDSNLLQAKRDRILLALSRNYEKPLIRRSKALYWNANHQTRVACSISKHYARRDACYWYAYHPQWDEFLAEAAQSFFVLGCMDLDVAFAIPRVELKSRLNLLNTTTREDGVKYWHIHLIDKGAKHYALALPKATTSLSLEAFRADPSWRDSFWGFSRAASSDSSFGLALEAAMDDQAPVDGCARAAAGCC